MKIAVFGATLEVEVPAGWCAACGARMFGQPDDIATIICQPEKVSVPWEKTTENKTAPILQVGLKRKGAGVVFHLGYTTRDAVAGKMTRQEGRVIPVLAEHLDGRAITHLKLTPVGEVNASNFKIALG